MGDVRISKEFGFNPSVTKCFCCGEEYGLALFGTSWKDENGKTAKAPSFIHHGLCDKCQAVADQGGLMIIEVKDGETNHNPYRTGRLVAITKEAKERLFSNEESPIAYMEESSFEPLFGEFCKKKEDGTE